MPHPIRWISRCALAALALSVSLGMPACVGTPLPDPPSFAGALVSAEIGPQTSTVRLVGRPGAVFPRGATLRITDPPLGGVLVATNADGSFGRVIPGLLGDTFFVERVETDADVFLGAWVAPATGGALVETTPGPDGDMDGSPDAIDCAATDPAMSGSRCVASVPCRADSDCAVGQVCTAGTCAGAPTCIATAETCNGLDDDCNGLIDDGDPGGGVACTPTVPGCGVVACSGTPMCMPVVGTDHETCGNGIDDDCNGIVDDGC